MHKLSLPLELLSLVYSFSEWTECRRMRQLNSISRKFFGTKLSSCQIARGERILAKFQSSWYIDYREDYQEVTTYLLQSFHYSSTWRFYRYVEDIFENTFGYAELEYTFGYVFVDVDGEADRWISHDDGTEYGLELE